MLSTNFIDRIPMAATMGIEIVDAAKERVTARLPHSDALCTAGGVLHGGALMAFADTVGAACAFLNLPEGAGTATIESKTNFFRPVTKGYVEATTTPLHVGRSTIVVQTDLRDDQGRRVAIVTQTQAVIGP